MDIKLSKNDNDVYLLELTGVMDLYSSNQVKELVMKMLKNKIKRFIINLKNVDNINSAGIGALIYVFSTLKKLGCPMIMVAPEGSVLKALETTKIKSYFTIVATLKEALEYEPD